MKFISVKNILQKGVDTFLRFPLPLVFAVAASVIGMYIADMDYREIKNADKLYEIILTCCLGVFSFIGLTTFIERQKTKSPRKHIISGITLLLLAAYFLTLPEKINLVVITRFLLLTIGLHAFAAFAPFIGKKEANGFWQFNRILFIRFITSALYSAVLYIGLALALLAIDNLFNVHIDSKHYFRLWIFITGIFNTWFFLSGVPEDYDQLENNKTYPLGLKVFSQYILLSLVTIYLIILYVYGAKILLRWQLPMGWVSYLVTGFAALGILSLLLLHPIRLKVENKFIQIYTKWFYIILLPLILLLFIAILRRISDYGITENRYFIFVIAIWLTAISIYLLINKISNIKIIPVTLAILSFTISFGPWGAFNISLKSQIGRFEELIKKENILVNGKVKKFEKPLPFKVRQQLSTVVEYISDYRSYKLLQPYFRQNLDSLFPDSSWSNKPVELMKLMGQEFVSKWQREENSQEYFYYGANRYNDKNGFSISGFQYVLPINEYYNTSDTSKDTVFVSNYHIGDLAFKVEYVSASNILKISNGDSSHISFKLNDYISDMQKKYAVNDYKIKSKDMIHNTENETAQGMLVFTSINGNFKNNRKKILVGNIQADLYFRYKPLQIVIDKAEK